MLIEDGGQVYGHRNADLRHLVGAERGRVYGGRPKSV